MNRRIAIRNIAIFSAGLALLPSCGQEDRKSISNLTNFKVTGSQEDMLAELSETIIPASNGMPGSKELSTNQFILMMVDDCMNKEGQDKFVKGMDAFEKETDKRFGHSFAKTTPDQRKEFLTAIDARKDISDDILGFYGIVKRFTVQNFTNSKYYLTKVRVYELVPGRFHGCVAVRKS